MWTNSSKNSIPATLNSSNATRSTRWASSSRSGEMRGGKVWMMRGLAMLLVVGLCEGALQGAFHLWPRFGAGLLAPWDPRGQQLLPHPSLVYEGNRYWPEHDGWGFRNSRVPARADIVTLGDSQTYGTAAMAHESWPAQLAERSGRTVYNMGLGGYCAVQAYKQLEQALSLDPQTVLFGFYFGNDLYDAFIAVYEHEALGELRDSELAPRLAELQREQSIAEEIARATARPCADPMVAGDAPQVGGIRSWVSSHVMVYAAARAVRDGIAGGPNRAMATFGDEDALWPDIRDAARRIPEVQMVFERGAVRTVFVPGYRSVVQNIDDARMAEGLRLCLECIARMERRCRERSVEFGVVLLPTKEFVFAPLVGGPARNAFFEELVGREERVRQAVLAGLGEIGVRTIDVLPALREAVRAGRPVYPASENGHPNAAGYGVIAEQVRKRRTGSDT